MGLKRVALLDDPSLDGSDPAVGPQKRLKQQHDENNTAGYGAQQYGAQQYGAQQHLALGVCAPVMQPHSVMQPPRPPGGVPPRMQPPGAGVPPRGAPPMMQPGMPPRGVPPPGAPPPGMHPGMAPRGAPPASPGRRTRRSGGSSRWSTASRSGRN